jgi:formylglycine-generating enzyme required for sulfatase activity
VPGYEIVRELGRGGMGAVYQARQTKLNRPVALKMILAGGHAGAADLARFQTEAEAIARLRHPNIVQVYEVGEHEGKPFFSLEFCPGGSLEKRLGGTPLPPKEAASLVETLARAMQAAHEQKVIHRDLKPANVLLAEDGTPKVTDFGLAKKLDEAGQTQSGAIVGTPSYMAPEQAGGKSGEVGPLADVYALGAILYECLTGRPPFKGPTLMNTVLQVVSDEPVPPRQLQSKTPKDLETICLRCLQKEPHKRYPTAAALADDLRRFLEGRWIVARPVGRIERVAKWARRNPALAGLLGAVATAVVVATVAGLFIRERVNERNQATHAAGLVRRLFDAETGQVPTIVTEMEGSRRWTDPLLRQAYQEAEAGQDPRKQLRASLALLPADEGQVPYLYGRLLAAAPEDVAVIRGLLAPHNAGLVEPLWGVLADRAADPRRRLRAACALAAYAPDDGRWAKVSGDVAGRLVAENALAVGKWAEALRPAGRFLLPPLAALLLEEGRSAESRRLLTRVYASYVEGVPDALAPLEQVLAEAGEPKADGQVCVALARRQADAAAALGALGRWQKVWPQLRHTPDPTRRSYLIDRLGPGGVEARALIDHLSPGREPDVSARRALLLALGEFDSQQLLPAEREAFSPRLLALYRDDPDPGVHGAAGWLLRHWGQQAKVAEIDRGLATGKVEGNRGWYVNGQGQTMVLVRPGEFETNPSSVEGKPLRVRVERPFALAAREVTVAEFLRFRKDHQHNKEFAPTEDCPVNMVSWYDAAAYCNWLSKEEGIAEDQWCYLPNEKAEYAAGMKIKAGTLSLSGYRLPTEAEWELACRARSVTSWSMGNAEDLLGKYAWYLAKSQGRLRPVGRLRPNDLGLFDLYGNEWEWCQNRYDNSIDMRDVNIDVKLDTIKPRSVRGGAIGYNSSDLRSAIRRVDDPPNRGLYYGFRRRGLSAEPLYSLTGELQMAFFEKKGGFRAAGAYASPATAWRSRSSRAGR